MSGPNDQLFRPKALSRMSSPENLDSLMHVVRAKDWIPLMAITGLLAMGGLWAVVGSVPTKIFGRGVLLRPRRIASVQSLGGGRLETLHVRPGDSVRKGQVLARVDQSELRRRIQDDRQLLMLLTVQDQSKASSRQQLAGLQQQQDELERKSLQSQRRSLERGLADAQALTESLRRRYQMIQESKKAGLTAELAPEVIQSEEAWRDNQAKILDYKARLEQIDTQVKQLETRYSALERENLDASSTRQTQLVELRARIAQAELQLSKSGDVVSEYTGRVVEVFAASGQVLPAGGAVLTVEIQDAGAALVALLYFPVKDGKKVQPGMLIQVAPDSVERHRFGGLVAKVTSVSPLPVTREGALNTIGNSELVREVMTDGAYLEITADLQPDASAFSGYRWSSSRGPQVKLSSGLTVQGGVTVERRSPATYLLPLLRESSGLY
jgi:HlyD family secretion protein